MHGMGAVWERPALSAWLEVHGAFITLAGKANKADLGVVLAWL